MSDNDEREELKSIRKSLKNLIFKKCKNCTVLHFCKYIKTIIKKCGRSLSVLGKILREYCIT